MGAMQRNFSIDDAFEEEADEAIHVYTNNKIEPNGITTPRYFKSNSDAFKDSDSLIHEHYQDLSAEHAYKSCFTHPKVRENWRMVLAAVTLLLIGLILIAMGVMTLTESKSGLQGGVFVLAGFICFVPGAYHVVYIYLAAKGKRGYHFQNLPLFT